MRVTVTGPSATGRLERAHVGEPVVAQRPHVLRLAEHGQRLVEQRDGRGVEVVLVQVRDEHRVEPLDRDARRLGQGDERVRPWIRRVLDRRPRARGVELGVDEEPPVADLHAQRRVSKEPQSHRHHHGL